MCEVRFGSVLRFQLDATRGPFLPKKKKIYRSTDVEYCNRTDDANPRNTLHLFVVPSTSSAVANIDYRSAPSVDVLVSVETGTISTTRSPPLLSRSAGTSS